MRRNIVLSFSFLLASGVPGSLLGADRVSPQYLVQGDIVDAGGGLQASVNYQNQGSVGGFSASVQSAAYSNSNTHVGRLFVVVGRELVASPPTVDEDASRQVYPRSILDDSTRLVLDAASFTWSVLSGPASVNSGGLVSGQAVYEDTAVQIQAADASGNIPGALTVLDTLPDNFGIYAEDGLPDAWQVLHFGPNNPLAAPSADPDGDGQSNAFEEVAGTLPGDASSKFHFEIQPHPDLEDRMQVQFSPRWNDRTYSLLWTDSLSGQADWNIMPSGTVVEDDGNERIITDRLYGAPVRFYKLEIERD